MKNYTLKSQWNASDPDLIDKKLIAEFKNPVLSHTEKRIIGKTIRQNATVDVSDEELVELDALHEKLKPELPEGSVYEVIALNATRHPGGVLSGILNCRVNGQHVQVRF